MKFIALLLILVAFVICMLTSCSSGHTRMYKVKYVVNGIHYNPDINDHVEVKSLAKGYVPGDVIDADQFYIQTIKDTL